MMPAWSSRSPRELAVRADRDRALSAALLRSLYVLPTLTPCRPRRPIMTTSSNSLCGALVHCRRWMTIIARKHEADVERRLMAEEIARHLERSGLEIRQVADARPPPAR